MAEFDKAIVDEHVALMQREDWKSPEVPVHLRKFVGYVTSVEPLRAVEIGTLREDGLTLKRRLFTTFLSESTHKGYDLILPKNYVIKVTNDINVGTKLEGFLGWKKETSREVNNYLTLNVSGENPLKTYEAHSWVANGHTNDIQGPYDGISDVFNIIDWRYKEALARREHQERTAGKPRSKGKLSRIFQPNA